MVTWFMESSAALVMLDNPLTETVDFTRYAVPTSLDRTVTPLAVVTLTAATVGVGAVASTVIDNAAEVVAFPAASVSVTEILQTPSAKVPSVQVFDEIVQVTLADPALVAVTTAVPENEPETLILGVLSEVTLSEDELPKSDTESRSGVDGVATVVLFITNPVNAVEELDVTLLYVCVAANEYVPFASVGNVQEPVEPVAVNVHVTAFPEDGVAVNVITAPVVKLEIEISGVSSFVLLSVLDDPRSDAATKSGVPVAANVTVTESVDTNERFPAASTVNSRYVPGVSPVAARLVAVFADVIETLFQEASAAPVILARLFTVTEVLTK
jgi:hypothetical protein